MSAGPAAHVIGRLRRDPGLLLVLIATCATIALYARTLDTGIINYDDGWLVADNWVVQDPSWSSLSTIFFDLDSPKRFVIAPEYLPVRDLSVMLDFAIWGQHYGGHHLTNLVLYVAAIWIWFAAVCRFGIDRKIAGIALLIWALHPSHAESVAWLAERKGLLAIALSGAVALAYARFREAGKPRWLVLAAIAAVLAVWSKAHAAFAIAALVGLEALSPRESLRRALVGLGVVGVAAAIAFVPVLVVASHSDVVGVGVAAPAGRFEMVLGVHGFYVQAAAMLRANAVSYPISVHGPSIVDLAIGALSLAAVIAAVAVRRVPREVRMGSVLWLFGWLPVSHLILPLQMIFVADRYLLIPSLGFALVLAAGIARIPKPRAMWLLVGAIAVAASLRTLAATASWRDTESLWERAVASNPDDGMAWSMYAKALLDRGRPDLALAATERGLARGRDARLLLRRALLLLEAGARADGIALMREAADAGEGRAMSNLALLLLADKAVPDALVWAERGVERMPQYGKAHSTLGKVALAAAKPDVALAAFTRAYDLAPADCTNRYNLALAELETKRLAAARTHAQPCTTDPRLGVQTRALLDEIARRQR